MNYKIARYGATITAVAGMATSVFAQADADGLVGTLDFTGLTANAASVVAQAFPVAALAGGIGLAIAFLGWVVSHVKSAIRSRRS